MELRAFDPAAPVSNLDFVRDGATFPGAALHWPRKHLGKQPDRLEPRRRTACSTPEHDRKPQLALPHPFPPAGNVTPYLVKLAVVEQGEEAGRDVAPAADDWRVLEEARDLFCDAGNLSLACRSRRLS